MVDVRQRILDIQEAALCFVRKWWRPVTCIGIAGGSVVNLMVIPLYKMEVPNMVEAAAYITASAAAFGVRAFEKYKGLSEG